MKKVKVAQIGVEHDHAAWIMNSLRELSDVFEVAAFADPEGEVVYQKDAKQYTVGGFNYEGDLVPRRDLYEGIPQMSVEELLDIPGLEGVIIETSETNLFKYALMAAKKGLHVHMDKPGGLNIEEFEELVSVMKETGKVLHLGYMYRYNPELQRVIADCKAGKYGEIYSIEAQMNCMHGDAKREWMRKYPGGMMFFLGCHLVDFVYRVLGEPEEVIPYNTCTGLNGITEGEDLGFTVLKYKNGVSFVKTCDDEAGGFLRRQIVVSGSKGTVEVHPIEAKAADNNPSGSRQYTKVRDVYFDQANWMNDGETRITNSDRYNGMMTSFAELVRGEKENPYTMDYELAMFRVFMKACGR